VFESEARRTFILMCIASFSAVTLLLAMIGIYGMLSLMVSSRTREIGVRIALGSTNTGVARFVASHALRVVGVALVAGLAASVLLGRFLSALLFGVANGDPVTLVFVTALLACASLVACAVPAVRAARIEPIRALHEE
jgi:ABC-type antimicrobial peptide transport system permease subunit